MMMQVTIEQFRKVKPTLLKTCAAAIIASRALLRSSSPRRLSPVCGSISGHVAKVI